MNSHFAQKQKTEEKTWDTANKWRTQNLNSWLQNAMYS